MRWEQPVEADAATWPDLVARLDQRPSTWLKPFLLLATAEVAQPGTDGPKVWLRLSSASADHTARFWWRPHGRDDLFDRFVGEIGLDREQDQIRVWVAGTAEGGDTARTDRVMRTLVALLATAFEEVSATGTG